MKIISGLIFQTIGCSMIWSEVPFSLFSGHGGVIALSMVLISIGGSLYAMK